MLNKLVLSVLLVYPQGVALPSGSQAESTELAAPDKVRPPIPPSPPRPTDTVTMPRGYSSTLRARAPLPDNGSDDMVPNAPKRGGAAPAFRKTARYTWHGCLIDNSLNPGLEFRDFGSSELKAMALNNCEEHSPNYNQAVLSEELDRISPVLDAVIANRKRILQYKN